MGNSSSRDHFQPIASAHSRPAVPPSHPYHVRYDGLPAAHFYNHLASEQYANAHANAQHKNSADGEKWRITMCSHNDPDCLGEYFNQDGQVYKMMSPEELARHTGQPHQQQHHHPEFEPEYQRNTDADPVEHMFDPVYEEPPPIRRQNMAQVNSPGLNYNEVKVNLGYGIP